MKVQVIAAVIEKEGKYLLGKRSPRKSSAPGYWCPVSGRVEEGESYAQAVEREVFEEVGLEVEALAEIACFPTHDGSAEIHWWRVRVLAGDAYLKCDEHTELRWVGISEMEALEPMFEEDRELFREWENGSRARGAPRSSPAKKPKP